MKTNNCDNHKVTISSGMSHNAYYCQTSIILGLSHQVFTALRLLPNCQLFNV